MPAAGRYESCQGWWVEQAGRHLTSWVDALQHGHHAHPASPRPACHSFYIRRCQSLLSPMYLSPADTCTCKVTSRPFLEPLVTCLTQWQAADSFWAQFPSFIRLHVSTNNPYWLCTCCAALNRSYLQLAVHEARVQSCLHHPHLVPLERAFVFNKDALPGAGIPHRRPLRGEIGIFSSAMGVQIHDKRPANLVQRSHSYIHFFNWRSKSMSTMPKDWE